jgi:predicted transcriptional regulator
MAKKDKIEEIDKHDLTDLLLELSSPIRFSLLTKLDQKDWKQSKIAKELDMTLPESHRQFERLLSAGLTNKNSEGLYYLTPFGKIIMQQIKSIVFLGRFKEYFSTHSVEGLPEKFIKRISDLNECQIIEGAFVISEKMKEIASGLKYLKVVSAHVPPDAFRHGLVSAVKSKKQVQIIYAKNTLIPKGFKKEFTDTQVQSLISAGTYQRKMIDAVKIYVVLDEKTAMVLFPDLKGNVDLSCGFLSQDARFHEWCQDYHQYLWDKGGSFNAELLRES